MAKIPGFELDLPGGSAPASDDTSEVQNDDDSDFDSLFK
jgi:hypothetical protein